MAAPKPTIVHMSRTLAAALGLPRVVFKPDGMPTSINIDTTILVAGTEGVNYTWHEWPVVTEDEQA